MCSSRKSISCTSCSDRPKGGTPKGGGYCLSISPGCNASSRTGNGPLFFIRPRLNAMNTPLLRRYANGAMASASAADSLQASNITQGHYDKPRLRAFTNRYPVVCRRHIQLREVIGCLNPEECEETEDDVDSERNRIHATFEFDCSPARNPRDRQRR